MSPPPRGPRLRIVAINDVYLLDNFPRFGALVEHHRTTDPADAFLVTLAGDFLAPSVLSSLDSGRAMVDCLNAVGVTHVTFGNHETDVAPEQLRRRMRELQAAWLATNVRPRDVALPKSLVLEVGRARVGLLGVCTLDDSLYSHRPFAGCDLQPANAAALAEAARLVREERCACVVPLTHQTLADDQALARAQREPPFPVIVGGHEHEAHVEEIAGTSIVKATSEAADAVVVDLVWPAEAPVSGPDLPAVTARVEPVAGYPEDAALRALVDAHLSVVHAMEAATLVTLRPGEALSSIGTRVRQTSMGTLVCSRVRDALRAEGCLFNGGGIRGARDYRAHLTYGDVKTELPFENEVVVVSLPGRVVREAVATSRSNAPFESGGFLQVDDGMTVEGPRATVMRIAGAPLDPDREYRIAIVRDLMTGLNNLEPLLRFTAAHPEKIPPALSGREAKVILVEAFSIALWKQLGGFDEVDANHDGVVTEPEIEAALGRAMAEPPSPVTADLVMHALDTNHDQVVSREEAATVEGGKA